MAQSSQPVTNNDTIIVIDESNPITQRATYSRLMHEMQFRATKNALMNYHEAEQLESKRHAFKIIMNTFTVVAASGLFTGIVKKGKVLANKAGLAGVVGLPICSIGQVFDKSSSELLPNYGQHAKKHIQAAAGWVGVAETARAERLRIDVDPKRRVEEIAAVYSGLVDKKAKVASEVLISQKTHQYFSAHPEIVLDTVKRRGDAYKQFVELEMAHLPLSTGKQETATLFYF
ncbi:hypothetical protein PoB_007420200 [Plakobranchus ocellatus]|uniref:SMODS and SLOG-associating 2TM effector domain-containing protein n=1 Tax=Plakobranchus ocellatus TaxID=259542 RepID=A0AAV4DTL5_9GAST|nr:hypothetical protein PoB_007420200 [Plakobranchus ocellatus]